MWEVVCFKLAHTYFYSASVDSRCFLSTLYEGKVEKFNSYSSSFSCNTNRCMFWLMFLMLTKNMFCQWSVSSTFLIISEMKDIRGLKLVVLSSSAFLVVASISSSVSYTHLDVYKRQTVDMITTTKRRKKIKTN